MLFARTLTYSEPETFILIHFYNMYNCYYYYFILFVCFVYISLLICIFSSAYLQFNFGYVLLLHNVIIYVYTVLCL
jgi:hypothetical protein